MWNINKSVTENEESFMDATTNITITEEKSSIKRGDNCFPVMIEHLNRYGENLNIWGSPVKLVTFLGIVHKIEICSTKVNFEFRDETGSIEGVKWLDSSTGSYKSPVSINFYARVYGMMRSQNSKHFVLIFNIQCINHLNELLTHLMEVTVMCLQGEKLMHNVAETDNLLINYSTNLNTINMSAEDNLSGLNKEHTLIMNIIQHSDPEYGAERSEIKSKVPLHIAPKVDEILEFLSSEGHIYTTKTDDYFKVL